MCGIIGIIGKAPVTPLLVDALKRLEYRGYDSAGVATLINGHIDRRRAEGKLINLEAKLAGEPLAGTIGIGHTRWATHGKPSERNAHPIATDRVAVVHNGIIENFQELKDELVAEGRRFDSDTDTEVVAQLLTSYLERQLSPEQAMEKAMGRFKGAFALVALFAGRHDILIGARRGSSLAVGYGEGAMYIGTDALALAPFTDRVAYLEEGDWAVLRDTDCLFYQGVTQVTRTAKHTGLSSTLVGKGNHPHFMLKEICEQPTVLGDTMQQYLDPSRRVRLPALSIDWKNVSRLTMTACGTANFACQIAKYWFEKLARLPVDTEIASEMGSRKPPLSKGSVCVAVSQSGETADTIRAIKYAKQEGLKVVSVVNVPESQIARLSDVVLLTVAGPEIAVASTKAFTTQLLVLLSAAIDAGRARGTLSEEDERALTLALIELPRKVSEVIDAQEQFKALGALELLAKAKCALYLGRDYQYLIAMEGALKLKELTYISAEGYAGGEMKHGPIALVDSDLPVFVLAPSGPSFDEMVSNFEQVKARGGQVILLTDARGASRLANESTACCITLPDVHPDVAPILYAVAVQLIAYHTALSMGRDIDQPRNLAKSVSVA